MLLLPGGQVGADVPRRFHDWTLASRPLGVDGFGVHRADANQFGVRPVGQPLELTDGSTAESSSYAGRRRQNGRRWRPHPGWGIECRNPLEATGARTASISHYSGASTSRTPIRKIGTAERCDKAPASRKQEANYATQCSHGSTGSHGSMLARARNSGHLREDFTDEALSSCRMADADIVDTTWRGRSRGLRRPVGHMLCSYAESSRSGG